jgi:glucokinase
MPSSFAIGVDLGGTNLRIACIDSHGQVIEKVETGAQVSRGRDFVIRAMTDAIKSITIRLVDKGTLAGVGIGVPGIINKATGTVRKSPNLPDWRDYPVKEEIEGYLGAPVILENDANVAAVGENWLGVARGVDSMCIITLGTGVGGGIVINGDIWDGMTGMAGELGHITIEPDGHPCNCGNRGCIEQLASGTAVLRMAREAMQSGDAEQMKAWASSNDQEFTAKSVFVLAEQGDPTAKAIFHKVGVSLGILMADLVNTFNFPMYVIGGGVSRAWDAFAPSMFVEARRRSMVYAATAPEAGKEMDETARDIQLGRTIITRALLGSDAGLFGAARLPFLRVPHAVAR